MPWAVVETFDDATSELLTHIVPIVENGGFDTRAEAEAFLERVIAAGSPCLTDDDGNITSTYFGHTLTSQCPCGAAAKPDDPYLYIHHQVN